MNVPRAAELRAMAMMTAASPGAMRNPAASPMARLTTHAIDARPSTPPPRLRKRISLPATKRYSAETRILDKRAKQRFDKKMTVGIFDQIAHAPYAPAAPVVPSTLVLSSEGKAAAPAPIPAELKALGRDVRHLPEVGHPFWLHDADATFGAIRDAI